MKDIAITNDFFPKIGGAHTMLYEICRRSPFPVVIVTKSASGQAKILAAKFDEDEHDAVKIVRHEIDVSDIDLIERAYRKRMGLLARRLAGMSDEGAVTFHCLRAFPEGLSALWTKIRWRRRARIVVYAHGEEVLVAQSSRQLRFIASMVYRYADLVIANSRSTKHLVLSLCPRANVECINPGVNVAAFERSDNEVARYRESWGWPPEMVVACTIARMEPRKNHAAVIRAVSALRKTGLPIAYICGGAGAEYAALAELVHSLGISDFVRLSGALSEEDKVLTFRASDFHVMPSIRTGEMIEGYGIVFLEAAAAGIPSICGSVGGQPEAVLDGVTGIVVNGSEPAQVFNAMHRLLVDRSLRENMGREGRAWAKKHDWNEVAQLTWEIIAKHTGRSVGAAIPTPGR